MLFFITYIKMYLEVTLRGIVFKETLLISYGVRDHGGRKIEDKDSTVLVYFWCSTPSSCLCLYFHCNRVSFADRVCVSCDIAVCRDYEFTNYLHQCNTKDETKLIIGH